MDDAGWNTPEALARDFAPAIFRLAYARTGNRADAEDVMQETFLRLLRARPEFADRAHARAWLLRVAANCANDWFRAPRGARPLRPKPSPSGGRWLAEGQTDEGAFPAAPVGRISRPRPVQPCVGAGPQTRPSSASLLEGGAPEGGGESSLPP